MRAARGMARAFRLLAALFCAAFAASGTAIAATRPTCSGGTVVLPAAVALGPPGGGVDSLHPVLMSGSYADLNAVDLLYRPLLWLDDRERIDWNESLASRIDVDPGLARFTVTLRPWHWSDGTDVTADDVLYTWSLIREAGHAYIGFDTGGVPDRIRAITAPDPHTVVFTLTGPVNPDWFERVGIIDFTPLPRHAWSRWSLDAQRSLQTEPSFYRVVDGPFRLASLSLGREAVFVANRRYDGHRPPYDRLVDDFLSGVDPLEALRAGTLDAAFLPFDLWSAAQPLRQFRRVSLHGQGNISAIVLNLHDPHAPFLADLAVRQAIARAIDQQQLIATVFHGQSRPQPGFVATGLADQVPPELRDGNGPLSFDPDASRALLDAAGYRPGPDGIRVRHGQRLALTMLITADVGTAIMAAELIEADLARVGVALDIKQLEFNQQLARLLGPRDTWDANLFAFGSGAYPDGGSWFAPDSPANYGGYADPTMNRLLRAAETTPGNAALFALERYAVLQQPMIFLPDGDPSILVRPGLDGVARLPGPEGEFSPERLTLAADCLAPHG